MKLFNARQMRDWDAYSISQQNITSLDLMERAAQQCTDWIVNQNYADNIQIICGKGNNGGDGLAIARLLRKEDKNPRVFVVDFTEKQSDDFGENLRRLQQTDIEIVYLKEENDFEKIKRDGIIIEALFGFGLHSPLEQKYASLVNFINQLSTTMISIDVPAGMFTDISSKGNTIIKAKHTLTFQAMKLCFLVADNADFFGDVHVLPIGLNEEFEQIEETKFLFADSSLISSFYKFRKKFSHKGTYGHALLVAGNEGKMGAAVMCATSCLRSGVGLLTCSVPPADFAIIHTTIPEAMVIQRGEEKEIDKFSVIGMGPGLGTDINTTELVHSLLQKSKSPMVIDADALNILSRNKDWLKEVPEQSVLTPHLKEFDRLWGDSVDDFDRIEKAMNAAKANKIIILLKGTYTLITDGVRNYFNSTGNNGMATGGSGDILTGLITGLISQKYSPFEAAVVAAYIHGLAADLCLEEQSYESLLPMDVVAHFGKAFQHLQKNKGA